MATRLNYVLPIARRLLADASRRLRGGGLAASIDGRPREKPFVIVTGAGRSGTSAVARVLHESGVSMGGELGEASEYNPEGFYEDMGVWWLHEQLLTELGMSSVWDPERWPWRSTVLAVARNYRPQMETLVAGAGDGWKDPRFAVTLEAWLPLLPARPKLVICLRSPAAFADSAVRIFGLVDRAAMERQWAKHYRRLLDVIRDYRLEATCVDYDELIEHPKETLDSLATFVGHPLQAEYIDPPLRHFTRPVPKQYARLYREVRALSGDGDSAFAIETPGQGDVRQPADSVSIEAIDAYIQEVNEVDLRTQATRAIWMVQVGLPHPKITQVAELGLTLAGAMEQTHTASATYRSMLKDAQGRLADLEPPPGFERFHDLAQQAINIDGVVTELLLAATKGDAIDQRMLNAALRLWQQHGRAAAVEKARERRQREYARALAASGYLAARAKESSP